MPDISMKELIRELRRQHFTVELTANNHYKVTPPNPKCKVMHIGNPAEVRSQKNQIALLKKAGFVPPWEDRS